MAVELSIKLTRTVDLATLIELSERVLGVILNFPSKPKIDAAIKDSRSTTFQPEEIPISKNEVLLGEDQQEIIFDVQKRGVALLTIMNLRYTGERIALIDAGVFRTSMSLVLAAAIAIALSRLLGAPIEDDARMFNLGTLVDPEQLLSALRLDNVQSNPQSAAIEVCERIGIRFSP
jgi:hypothetical protein